MKLQTKIILLISGLAIIFAILISSIQYVENKKTVDLLQNQKKDIQNSFNRTINSIEKTLEIFSTDYTQWDEMAAFVKKQDPKWAFENIEIPLQTFKANAVWIYNDQLLQVYSVNNLSSALLKKFPLDKNQLQILLSRNFFNHFFIKISDQLFEIRSAPIQPTADVERKDKPLGFFFTARLWSRDLVNDLSMQTSSRISIKAAGDSDVSVSGGDSEIIVSEPLLDWKKKPIYIIFSTSDFPFLKKSKEVFNIEMLLGVSFSLCVFISVFIFLIVAVNKPLKVIQYSLEQQNPALLTGIAKEKTEFGKLCNLIIQFFNQKERLIDEERQRVIAESSLNKSEAKYKKIFDNVQDVFYQTDLNGIIISVSPSIERYSEYKQSEVLGKNIMDYYLDPGIRTKFINTLKEKGEVIDFEIYFVKKSGQSLPCSVNAHFIYEDGKVAGIEGSLRDASERKKNEEQILKLSRAIEQSPIAVAITDIAGNIEYINPRFSETSGYSIDELINNSIDAFKSDLTQDKVYFELWETIGRGEEWKGELLYRKKNGERFWQNVFITPVRNSDNIIINYLALIEDITEKKKIIEELKTAKEKAEEMNNMKSSFLANMSHELRTPMMGILGNAEIISISTEDEEIKSMASAIYLSGRRLINTLNLILDLSRIEANKESLDIEKIEVVSIISEIIEHFTPAAKQKALSLTLSCDKNLIYSHLDERLFREVLNNLVNNAIKFTNIGEIVVKLYADREKMIIKVTDTGIGIPAHSLGVIFEEFRQVSEGYGRNFEGTGLGLTITKKFVEKLGGRIYVKSVLDEGSEFTIELPYDKELSNE